MKIDNRFNLGQSVYLIHDPEQLPRMITEITVSPNGILYEVSSGTVQYVAYGIELSLERNLSLIMGLEEKAM